MKILLPTRDFSVSVLFVAVCALIGGIAWDQRHEQSLDEQVPVIFFLACFSWAALYLLGKQILQGPLFYRCGQQRKFEIPLQSVHEVIIGPLHKVEDCFLLVTMKFEVPEDNTNEMRSFVLYKPKKNTYDKIAGQAHLVGSNAIGVGELLNQTEIDWCLWSESENFNAGPIYEFDLRVPAKGHDSHYLTFSPLKMKRVSSAIAGIISEQGLSVEVTLRVGYGIHHLQKRDCPTFEEAHVYRKSQREGCRETVPVC